MPMAGAPGAARSASSLLLTKRTWARYGRGAGEIWARCRRDTGEVQARYGRGVGEIWASSLLLTRRTAQSKRLEETDISLYLPTSALRYIPPLSPPQRTAQSKRLA